MMSTPGNSTYPARIRVGIGPRDKSKFPLEDSALCEALYGRLEGYVLERGLPRPAVIALEANQISQFDIFPILKAGGDVHRFISAVAGQPGIEAVAMVGLVNLRRKVRSKEGEMLGAMCFVEWSGDSRWFSAMRPVQDGGFRAEWPVALRSAIEGDQRPGGVGGWFSRARRQNLRLKTRFDGPQSGLNQVH